MTLLILLAAVLGMLAAERLAITQITRRPAGQEWVRRCRWLHPNSISLIRIPMGVLSLVIWEAGHPRAALLWFAAWMISDLTDGTIARNCGLETECGKWLDPLSDKCMYFPTLLFFAWKGALPWSWTVAVLLLDALGQASRLVAKKKAANLFGKAKTAFITILIAITALTLIPGTGVGEFVSFAILEKMEMFCTVLAFLSLYCKIIPDIWYANSLTLANFLCGAAAIWEACQNHLIRAFVLVFIGQFFDLFDGRMARKFGSTRYGAFFDDIADGTSFGLAISVLVYHGLALAGPDWFRTTAAAAALGYFVCVVYRLVRFLKPTVALPPGIFQGLPSPAGAVLAGAGTLLVVELAKCHGEPPPIWIAGLGLAGVLGAALLMISSIPYQHFGRQLWPSLPNPTKLLVFIFVLALTSFSIADRTKGYHRWSFSALCFAGAAAYALFGVQRHPSAATTAPPGAGPGPNAGL
ncbi:MAG: CDP-alcohol phosphatidyltransferase family protein [Lentisphaeria bacterium]|jgi:CDP-diacylglycerol--serine O-phosphatidyltransferase